MAAKRKHKVEKINIQTNITKTIAQECQLCKKEKAETTHSGGRVCLRCYWVLVLVCNKAP